MNTNPTLGAEVNVRQLYTGENANFSLPASFTLHSVPMQWRLSSAPLNDPMSGNDRPGGGADDGGWTASEVLLTCVLNFEIAD